MSNRQSGNEPEHSDLRPALACVEIQFGSFTLDLQKHALFRGAERVHLTAKPLQVLEVLVGRPGATIPKRDFLNAVWKDEFVTDDVLVQAVGEIRRALDDNKDDPAFIQTVPREGYRFIAPISAGQTQSARDQQSTAEPVLMAESRLRQAVIGGSKLRRRLTFILAVVSLAGSFGAAIWWRFRPAGTADWSQPRLIGQISGSPHSPALSPDGGRIAYVNSVNGIDQVFVQALDQPARTQLTWGDAPAESPRWSPKGRQILFSRGLHDSAPLYGRQSIWSVSPLGGPARMITEDGRNPAWSPDGLRIAFERGSDIWLADADGGNQRRLEGIPTSAHLLSHRTPSFSPDGSWIAFFHTETGPKGDFWVIPAKGGAARRLTFDLCQGRRPVWTPDGKWIVFASERSGVSALWKVPVSGGSPRLVFSGTGEDREPDISHDGRRLVFTNTRNVFVLTLLDPATGASRELTRARSNMTYPMFDPQGNRIALFIQDRERGADVLYTIALDGTNLRPLTHTESGNSTFPHWSGDGSLLYFYRTSASSSFRRIRVDGGPSQEVVSGWTWEVNYGARVDSRQKFILYSEEHAGVPVRTLIRDISTGEERPIAKALDDPRWSRDDRMIAGVDVSASRPPDGAVSVCPADGGPCRQVTNGYMPVWSADNSSIYFCRTGGEFDDGAELWEIAASGGEGRKVANLRPMFSIGQYYDVSPRGEVVYVQFRPGNRELWTAERR